MCELGLIVVIIAVATAWRVVLSWRYRPWISQGLFGDSAFHYCAIRALKADFLGYEGIPEFLLRNGPDRYPVLFQRLCCVFSLRTLERYPFLPNLIVFVAFAFALPSTVWLTPTGVNPYTAALATLFFVSSVPSNMFRGNGILFLSLSERLLAKLSVALYFLAALLWREYDGPLLLVVSIGAAVIALYTSKFSRQAILFTSVLWSLFSLDVLLLVPAVVALVVCTVVSAGGFIQSLRDQWVFSQTYRRYSARSRVFNHTLSKFGTVKLGRAKDVLRQLLAGEPGKSIIKHADLFVLAIFGASQADRGAITLILATLTVYLLTTTKGLRHFGESERYIDFNLAFVIPLLLAKAVIEASSIQLAVIILAVCGVYRLLAIGFVLWREGGRSIPGSESLWTITDLAIGAKSRVLALPVNLGQAISARTGCKVICVPGNYGPWLYERYVDEYPLLKRPLQRLVEEFQITHIVLNKAELYRAAKIVGWTYDFRSYRVVAEDDYWCCYAV